MKKIFLMTLIVAGLGFSAKTFADEKLIIVNGVAEKSLDPNMINLSVEVWSKAATAKQAQQLAAEKFKQVKKTFDEFKIKKEDIQTENYSLNPEYIYDQKAQQNKLSNFRVLQTLSVTLHKVDEAGSFLDAMVDKKDSAESGVNVNSITWDSDMRAKTEMSALADAVKASRAKAEEIAKAAGVRVKGVARISHGVTAARPPMPMMRNFAMKSAVATDAASTELPAGQIKVRVEVTAEYEIN
jgi:uncharacterized protein YggE